ncbi:manganese efflux pump MntP family protein [soil metagenome]
MSTDAFAAAVGKGAAMSKPRFPDALRAGVVFGIVEAITPAIGWLLGITAAGFISQWDHWLAFGLLGILGLSMIWRGSRTPAPASEFETAEPKRASLMSLAITGLATSIDAMAVGVGLAFVDTPILVVVLAIGLSTMIMVTIGIMVGRALGTVIGTRAEIFGGVILIGVGSVILYEHLHAAAVVAR